MERTMTDSKPTFATVDDYIATFPDDVRAKLEEMRAIIRQAAPDAVEKISYRMPALFQDGYVVYFGAFKHHIGLYPTPNGLEAFREELEPYLESKGTARFPLDEPLPVDLIQRIVKYRLAENLDKAKAKAAKMRRMK
jgi:uncharacterized protein YdhG (YjbR/CyaY superfamily)